jgi:hypothetical protein
VKSKLPVRVYRQIKIGDRAKRRRAQLEINLPKNNQLKTHRDVEPGQFESLWSNRVESLSLREGSRSTAVSIVRELRKGHSQSRSDKRRKDRSKDLVDPKLMLVDGKTSDDTFPPS